MKDWINSVVFLQAVNNLLHCNSCEFNKEFKRFKVFLRKKRLKDMKRALDFGVVSGYAESDNEWRDFDTNKLNRIMEQFKKREGMDG